LTGCEAEAKQQQDENPADILQKQLASDESVNQF